MIYLMLFLEFFKIGMFSFGGAYGAIALIQDTVMINHWMDEVAFSNVIAISESTPGSIMVNAATYIGNCQAGPIGALVATIGVILPAFVIILMLSIFLKNALKNRNVQRMLGGIKPCIIGIILATGLYMIYTTVLPEKNRIDGAAVAILGVLISVSFLHQRLRQREISPIMLIVIAAVIGCIL